MSRLFVMLQYLLPHHLLCRAVYSLTRARTPWLKNALIERFVGAYHPSLSEAVEPDPSRYASFNEFFTRELKPGARPLSAEARSVCSPCDGALSMLGGLEGSSLLQAKGHRYRLETLLADEAWAERLAGGLYATLYLAPSDYHRVHMPLDGTLRAAWHIPGRLFSVNASTAARVPGLFARNERIVCAFDGSHGPFAVVLVGALFVGSMSTVWHGEITPWRGRQAAPGAAAKVAPHSGVHLLAPSTHAQAWQPRGAELGRFNMGSTVILLLPAGAAHWDSSLEPGASVRVGQALGRLPPPSGPAP
jgi:phosphatidylserine decarboxylase